MKTLQSYVCGRWHEADSGFATLTNPSTEEPIARASSAGVDFGAVLAYARDVGGPALRALTFSARADLLKGMSKVLREHRDELLEVSRLNMGTTPGDGSFDIDGASGTLAYYFSLGRPLGERPYLTSGDGIQLGKTEGFWGQHVLVPKAGVAVHINAFNFPAWGFAEKAACSLLAGIPVVTKPATATAWVAALAIERMVATGLLPEGSFQLICGGTGDLVDRLGAQDVFAFTGSADTALALRGGANLLTASTRINIEADSLNAAVLAPDAGAEGTVFDLFVKDVVREMTQKAGQKCTAVRRILVPRAALGVAREALAAKLGAVVVGNPADDAVTMGPLATARQLADAVAGVSKLRTQARLVVGSGERMNGVGSPEGKGYFFGPTLLEADDPKAADVIHQHEVFGPVATLLPYDGSAQEAAALVALGGGTLVTSVYGSDQLWLSQFLANAGATTGRLYIGSEGSASAVLGSGIALPQSLHGGPGRAGGGAELAGLAGLDPYLQKVALQGERGLVEGLAGTAAG